MPRRGLPQTLTMRHDQHYVDALAASAGTPVGRLVPIESALPGQSAAYLRQYSSMFTLPSPIRTQLTLAPSGVRQTAESRT